MLIMAVWCTAMPVCAAVTYGIAPIGFEDGAIPTGWTQENLTGSVSWAVEGGTGVNLTYPAGAKSGEYRLAIRRPQGSGSKFVTRLISPSFDATQLANPELRFSHAQVASIGQFDTLRVYYRVSATGAWTQLAEYTSAITAWTAEALELPQTLQGAAYQIAFEVSDNNGYGVVVDDISVTQPSQCEVPSFGDIATTAETAYVEFVVGGTGKGSTADLFDVVVSKAAQAEPATPVDSLVVFSAKGTADAFVNLTGLTPDTEYFVYIRTNCVDNETGYTDWVSTTFTTPVRVEVPYTENFNNATGYSNFGTPHGWTLKTDTTTAVPFVYKGTYATYKTSYSVDSTAYMAFAGTASTSIEALPASKYAYAATPEIHDDLSQCEVSFWGTVYDKVYNGKTDYAAELTVGVMTNPTDYATFTPIETVHIESAYLFKKFSVSLASYTGTGKHVAFVSRSATKQNVFFIDNVSIYKPAVATPSLTVKNALPSGFEVVPSLPAGATWNLKVASTYVRDAATLTAEQCLVNLSGLTAANHTIAEEDAVLAGKTVTVYVQAVKNGVASDWSFPVTIRVPKRAVLPIDMTFNTGTYAEVALKSLNNEIHSTVATAACGDLYFPLTSFTNMYPAVSTVAPKYDGAHLNLNGIGNYCVLPYVEGGLDTLELTFRYASYDSDYQGKLAVGVMTDPYDLSTFVTVAEYDAVSGSKYAKIICDFSSYTGAGHYVALRALAPSVASATYGSANAIDNLSLHKVSTCRDASNLRAEADASKAVIRWDAAGMTQWLVRLYGNSTATDTVQEHVVAQDSILLTGLTPGTTYYYAVHTICGTDTLAVETADMGSFTTSLGVPYKQDFGTSTSLPTGWEQKKGLASSIFAGGTFSTGSSWSVSKTNTTVSKYLTTEGSYLIINNYGTSPQHWAIMPELVIEADANAAVALTFDLALTPYSESSRLSGVDDQFMVIISTDGGATWSEQNATIWNNKADSTTDYVYNDIPMNSFQKVNIDLSAYIGQKIRIAFYAESTVGNADNYIVIDNIQVKTVDANCLGITKLQAVATSDSQATVTWAAGGTQSIHLMVSEEGETTNVFEGDITDNPYTLTGLTGNTAYVVKAYQTCNPAGDTLTITFRTLCGSFAIADLGTITFDNGAEDILCWTVGVGDTVGVGSATLTKPYVYNSSKFGKVLYLKKPKTTSYYNYGNNYYAIMPALDIDSIKHYQVVLSAATNDNDTANEAKLYVGVLSNPLQPNQYDITDTITLQYAADSLHMRSYTLAFDDYEGDYLGNHGKYIIFLASAASNHSDVVLIDNIYLEPLSGCHQVNDMEAAVVTNASATLQWTGNAASYEVVVSDQMCNPDTLQNAVFEARSLTEKQVEVTGLSPQTTYYAYIRAICGEGDTARWSGHTIFKTACGVPYYENFTSTSLSEDWAGYKGIFGANDTLLMKNLSESSSSTAWYMTSLPSSIKGMSGTAARVEVYSTGSYNALLVSPAISLPSLEENGEPMRVSFKAAKGTYEYSGAPSKVSNSTDDKFSLIISTDDGETWTRANSTIWASDGSGDFDYNTFGLTALRCNVDITKYAGQSVRLGFYTESVESSPDTYFYLDSVSVDFYTPSCDGILNCKTLSAGADSIALQFKTTNATDVVEYVYGKDSVNLLTATGYRADDNNEAVLLGLTPGSTYAIYARTLCAAGDTSAWFGPVYADTKCLLTAPFAFNFDDTDSRYAFYTSTYGTAYYMENCWETLYSYYSYAPQVKDNSSSYTYSRSGNSALYFYMYSGSPSSYYGYAILPEMTSDMDTLMLTFWARPGYEYSSSMSSSDNSYLHSVEVGTMTDPTDTATFQRIKTVEILPVSGDPASDPMKFWRQYAVSLHGATGKYIAFRQLGGSKSNYVTIDDVEVVKQGCAMVENAWVDAIKPTSAKLHWQSEAEQFVITLASGASSVQYSSTDSVMTLSGLQQGKQYTVSVASVCGTDTSVAVINTFATAYSIPFTENFATIATAFPAAWKRYNSSYGSGITADALFAGTTSFAQKTPSTSTYEGWIYSSSYNKNAFEGSEHAYVKLAPEELYDSWYEDYEYYDSWYWMVSPVIDLTVVTDSAIYLSFDLALTSSTAATAPSSAANQRFYLLVSADGGTTWTKANALVWSNATADSAQYQLSGVATGKGTHYRMNFSQYIGQNIQVAFGTYANESSNNNALHLDNIDLDVPAACLPVSGCVLTTISKDNIAGVITPAEDATPDMYQCAYGVMGTEVADMTIVTSADSTFAIGGLTGGTTYDVYVRAICGAGDTSRWAGPYSAMTAFEYPFAETFDNISKGFPAGWNRYSGVVADSLFVGSKSFATAKATTSGWVAGNANALEDANHVKINVYSNLSNYWLVSPVVDLSEVSDAAIMLSFDAAYTKYDKTTAPTGTATQKFYVLVSEDGGATWSKQNATLWSDAVADSAQYTMASIPTGAGANYIIDFTPYIGKKVQVAFGVAATANDNDLHLDNIAIQVPPTCRKVQNITVSEIGGYSAKVNFATADSVAAQWQYVVCLHDSLMNPATAVTIDTTSFDLIGLQMNTGYDVYVRSICAVGDTSEWVGPNSFTTLKLYSFPFSESFDDISSAFLEDWKRYSEISAANLFNGTASFATATTTTSGWGYSSSYNANALEDANHVGVELYYSYSNSWLVSPVLDLTSVAENTAVELTFDAALTYWNSSSAPTATSSQRFYVLISSDGGNTWSKEDMTLWSDAASDSAQYKLASIPNGAGETYTIDCSKYVGGLVQIAFGAYASANDNRLHVDNISLDLAPTCRKVQQVSIVGITSSKATLQITPAVDSLATQWQYVLCAQGATLNPDAAVTLDTTVAVLDSLSHSTEYDVYVRSICGEGDTSAWVGPKSFATGCLVDLPVTYDFDDENNRYELYSSYDGSYDMENCWTSIYGLTSYMAQVEESYSDYDYDYDYGYYYYAYEYGRNASSALFLTSSGSYTAIAVMPEFNVDLDTMQLVFWGRPGYAYGEDYYSSSPRTNMRYAGASYERKIEVGTMTDPNDASTFRLIKTITAEPLTSSNYPDADPEGTEYFRKYKVALKSATGKYIAFRSTGSNYFAIDDVSFEKLPDCLEPTHDAVEVLSSTKALVHWENSADSVAARLLSATGTVLLDTMLNGDTLLLEGLSAGTTYKVSLQNHCGDAVYSEWTSALTFTTALGFPYTQDFEGENIDWTNAKGLLSEALAGAAPVLGSGSWSTTTVTAAEENLTNKAVRLNVYGTSKKDWYLSPVIDLTEVDTAQHIGMTMKVALSDYYDHTQVASGAQADDIFAVLVSEDGGATWTEGNVTRWDNSGSADYIYDAIPVAGQEYIILMDKYIGKTVQIALYAESTVDGGDNYLYVDDIEINYIDIRCMGVRNLQITPSSTYADISWKCIGSDSVQIELIDTLSQQIMLSTVTADSVFRCTNLQPNTVYSLSVQQLCGNTPVTALFRTNVVVPYLQEFEATSVSDLAGWERGKGLLSDIVAGGDFLKTSRWYCDSKATAAEANIEGKSAYIKVYSYIGSYSTTQTYDWLLSPVLDLTTVDSTMNLQLSMTLALSTSSGHAAVTPGEQPDDVFAVVISEDGGNTWTADNVTRWDTAATSAHSFEAIPVEGETYYVDLNKYKGKAVRIGLYAESLVENGDNYLYVDNFTIDNLDLSCMGVKLQIDSVIANTMYASWQTMGNDTVMVLLADEAGNTVYSATTTDTTLVQSNLAWHTTYTLTVQQICGSRIAQKTFITPYAPVSIPYFEPFGKEAMERWTEAGGVSLEEAFAGSEFTKTTSSWYIGLKTDGTEVNIHDTSAYMNVYSSSQKEWLISPSIIIPELDESASVELSLTAALSTYSGHAAIDPAKQQSHRFAVVISEDDGATWKQSNMTLWDNAGKGTYVYNDIPVEGRTYQIDLAKYQGKVIRVALYAGCTESSQGDNYLYVDDITIKGLVGVNYAAAQCNSADYHDEFFTIPYDSLVVGTTEYTTRRNGQENAPDTLYTLSLTVYPAVQTVIYDTICQGYRYTANGFDEEVLQSTMLSMRTTSSNGCDSMVTVYVEVLPTVYSDTTIYACTEYTLNGTTYYSNQVLMDTLVSATGCDSISRIFLRISPEASYETEWRTAICAGSSFSDEVFTDLTEPGTYVDTVSTRFGCDSIVTLHLLVADASMNVYDTIELEDLPYIYEGDTILSGAAQKGNVYKHDVHADCGTVTLNVYIKDEEMGISNVEIGSLTIAPNPVHAGEDIRLVNTFRPADDYVLTVHDALGQAVYTTHTAQSQIPGIPVSGYYVVRVVNNGQVFQTKLLVQ